MKNRIVDNEITLVKYYPNYRVSLQWYQDADVCRQVDNRDTVYDIDLLKCMYKYLDKRGKLFYVKYRGRLCGDVCLQQNGDIAIVIAKPWQNLHIGRRVIKNIILLAKDDGFEQLHAEIYSFNTQSQRMFTAAGFVRVSEQDYVYNI